jgi:hypothetical protein
MKSQEPLRLERDNGPLPGRVAVRATLAVLGKYIDQTTDWAVTKNQDQEGRPPVHLRRVAGSPAAG